MKALPFRKIAVYCGSNMGKAGEFSPAAVQLAEALVEANLTLIYGGAKVGIMGVIADTMLKLGGEVIGIIPEGLVAIEVAHEHLSKLHQVKTMHERKALMAELADAFIMFPGGPGSWEEFFEMVTWAKLGYHQKPCGILNVHNFYDQLIKFFDHAVEKGFVHEQHRQMIQIDQNPKNLLQKFFHYQAPTVGSHIT